MAVKASPIQLSQREGAAGTPVAVRERMDPLELMVEDGAALIAIRAWSEGLNAATFCRT